jgi:ribose 1,5-bisphosphokinase
MTGRGTLFLVVGPSGVGKDSIIAGAAECLRGNRRIVFARRVITRPATAGGEDHRALSPTEFAERRDGGRLMLHWHAQGLDYGLPRELAAALAAGSSVVANVSRTVVDEARDHLAPVSVVAVSASSETLAARLAGRGRESAADIASRLRRASAVPANADFVIDNDGSLDEAIRRFVAVLRKTIDEPSSL